MSYTATFDTLEFAKTLQAEGFQPKQAEGLSKALRQAFQDTGVKLQEEFKDSKNELATKGDIANLRVEIHAAKVELIKWMIGAIVATGGLCAAIASLFVAYFR